MSSEDQDKKLGELLRGSDLEKEYLVMNSPFFAQKVKVEIKRQENSPRWSSFFCRASTFIGCYFRRWPKQTH